MGRRDGRQMAKIISPDIRVRVVATISYGGRSQICKNLVVPTLKGEGLFGSGCLLYELLGAIEMHAITMSRGGDVHLCVSALCALSIANLSTRISRTNSSNSVVMVAKMSCMCSGTPRIPRLDLHERLSVFHSVCLRIVFSHSGF